MRVERLDELPVIEAGGPARTGRRVGRRRGGRWLLKGVALAVLAATAAWAYWANVSAAKPAMDMSMRVTSGATPFPVMLATVSRGAIAAAVTYTGTVAPYNEQDVFPRVTGRLVELPVYPGDLVRAGQVVARLDDVELGSRVREAQAATLAGEANVAQMEAEVDAARHGVTQMERELQMALAEVTAARDAVTQMEREVAIIEAEATYQAQVSAREERLFTVGAVSRQDLENARAMAAASRAKVEATAARASQMRAMVTAAEAKVDAARARLDQARAMEAGALRKRDAMAAMAAQSRAMQRTAEVVRDYVELRSPGSGYVVKRLVAPGVLVQPGMAILKIAEIDRVRLQANVGERDLPSIRVGSPVRVALTGDGAPITARVTAVFPFVDAGARTGVVEAVVENRARRLLPGQYVTMAFVTGERDNAITVPRGAVARLGGAARVWVVTDGRAEPRPVVTGLEDPERVEIRDGLAGTERVVARGHEPLYAGARVVDVAERATQRPAAATTNGAAPPRATPPDRSGSMTEMPGATQGTAPGRSGEPKEPANAGQHRGH